MLPSAILLLYFYLFYSKKIEVETSQPLQVPLAKFPSQSSISLKQVYRHLLRGHLQQTRYAHFNVGTGGHYQIRYKEIFCNTQEVSFYTKSVFTLPKTFPSIKLRFQFMFIFGYVLSEAYFRYVLHHEHFSHSLLNTFIRKHSTIESALLFLAKFPLLGKVPLKRSAAPIPEAFYSSAFLYQWAIYQSL